MNRRVGYKLAGVVTLILLTVTPSVAQETASVFTVYGTAYKTGGMIPVPSDHRVEVENLTTGAILSVFAGEGGPGNYALCFVDYLGNHAAAEGDLITIRVFWNESLVACTAPIELQQSDILSRCLQRNVTYGGPSLEEADTWSRIKSLFR